MVRATLSLGPWHDFQTMYLSDLKLMRITPSGVFATSGYYPLLVEAIWSIWLPACTFTAPYLDSHDFIEATSPLLKHLLHPRIKPLE